MFAFALSLLIGFAGFAAFATVATSLVHIVQLARSTWYELAYMKAQRREGAGIARPAHARPDYAVRQIGKFALNRPASLHPVRQVVAASAARPEPHLLFAA